MSEGRIVKVDAIKGIAITLMVVGHVVGGVVTARLPVEPLGFELFYRTVYLFHMAAFFFAAGVVTRTDDKTPFSVFLRGKAQSLLFPFYVWMTINWLGQRLASGFIFMNSKSDPNFLASLLLRPFEVSWFLPTLFAVYLLFALCRRLNIGSFGFFLVTLALFAARKLGFAPSSAAFQAIAQYALYFAMGLAAAPFVRGDTDPAKRRDIVLVILSSAAIAISIPLSGETIQPIAAVFAVAGITLLYALSGLALGTWFMSRLEFLGLHSLAIFLLSGPVSVVIRSIALRLGLGTTPLLIVLVATPPALLVPAWIDQACARRGVSLFRYPIRK